MQSSTKSVNYSPKKSGEVADENSSPTRVYHLAQRIKASTSLQTSCLSTGNERKSVVSVTLRRQNKTPVYTGDSENKRPRTIHQSGVDIGRKRLALSMKPRSSTINSAHSKFKGSARKKPNFHFSSDYTNKQTQQLNSTSVTKECLNNDNVKDQGTLSCLWLDEGGVSGDISDGPKVEASKAMIKTDSPQNNVVSKNIESKHVDISSKMEVQKDNDYNLASLQESTTLDSMFVKLKSILPDSRPQMERGTQHIPYPQKPIVGLDRLWIGCKYYDGVINRLLLSYDKYSIEVYDGCDQLFAVTLSQVTSLKHYSQTSPYLIIFKTKHRLKNDKFSKYYDPDDPISKKTQILCYCKNAPHKLIKDLEKLSYFTCESLSKSEWDKLCSETASIAYEEKHCGLSTSRSDHKTTKLKNSMLRSPTKSLRSKPSSELFVYPFNRVNALAVTNDDVSRLAEGEFLNDTLIEFYMRYIHDSLFKRNNRLSEKTHFFNPFFYHRLTQKPSNAYEKIKKWTSKIDLFEKEFIFVPINENLHWYLALICFPKLLLPKVDVQSGEDDISLNNNNEAQCDSAKRPQIIIFDSLDSRHDSVFKVLDRYLRNEAQEKKKVEIKQKPHGIHAKVPRQTNLCDCGVYLLQYMETFLNNPKKYLNLVEKQVDVRIAWFSQIEVSRKREQIRKLICQLTDEFKVASGILQDQ